MGPATDAGASGMAAPTPDPMATDAMAATRWYRPAMQADGYADVPADQVTANNLTGATVYGPDNQSVGEVGDLVVDADGKITNAIVDVGGFLGIGEHSVEVAFNEMQIMQNTDGSEVRVNISATKEQLEGRPEYQSLTASERPPRPGRTQCGPPPRLLRRNVLPLRTVWRIELGAP